MSETRFPAYVVRKAGDGTIRTAVETVSVDDLPAGDVLIRVVCSSLNYKDALAATGNPGVARRLPHVPGIDCAGRVESDQSGRFAEGERVLVTGYGLGTEAWGGYSQYVRVPVDWVVPLPDGLSFDEAMSYGTAGFTAAQAVGAIAGRGIDRERGEIVVTGATGGVGSFSVALLARAGYRVAAVTDKPEAHDYLRRLGAARLLQRDEVRDTSDRTLLKAQWSSAVDTVGG
ncbi:MAG: alcohol dehydrogenase catalytic domain-containing protein, partial [Pirellulales bacterium]